MLVAMAHVADVKPRVISAEVKRRNNVLDVTSGGHCWKPRIAGELALVGETTSEPHYVEVRDGSLLLYPGPGLQPKGPPLWRLPLRRLNLQPAASGRPRSFSLSRHADKAPLATFQVGSDHEYECWVKTLAIELMRQTPLDAVRFLDILGITASLPSISPSGSPLPLRRTHSADCVNTQTPPQPRRQLLSSSIVDCVHTPQPRRQPPCSSIKEEDSFNATAAVGQEKPMRRSPEDRFSSRDHCIYKKHGCNGSLRRADMIQKSELDVNGIDETDCLGSSASVDKDERRLSPPLPDVVRDLPPCERRSRARTRASSLRTTFYRNASAEPLSWAGEEAVARLMARCQQADQYVPVRDKRLLFESLCRKRLVCSSDNIDAAAGSPCGLPLSVQPRAQSLHDLSRCHSALPVKQLCRYFERDFVRPGRRISCAERLAKAKQQVAHCQDAIIRLQRLSCDESEAGDAVDQQLAEEQDRLKQSTEEMEKLQCEIGGPGNRFGVIATSTRHSSDLR